MTKCAHVKYLNNLILHKPTLSYHMKVLTECGLVIGRREGSWMKYSVNKEKVELVKKYCDYIVSKHEKIISNDTKINV